MGWVVVEGGEGGRESQRPLTVPGKSQAGSGSGGRLGGSGGQLRGVAISANPQVEREQLRPQLPSSSAGAGPGLWGLHGTRAAQHMLHVPPGIGVPCEITSLRRLCQYH